MPLISKPHSFNGDFRKRMGFFFYWNIQVKQEVSCLRCLLKQETLAVKRKKRPKIKSREGMFDFKAELEKTLLPRVYTLMIQQVKVTS